MAWQPPEDELDSNVLQQWKPPEDELDKNLPDQWSPPEDELDNSPTKIKDVGALKQMKDSGQKLTYDQERVLFDAEDKKPFTQKVSEAVNTFVPTAIDIAKQLGSGAGEFIYKGVLKPIDAMSQSPEEAEKTLKEAGNIWRSGAHGFGQDIQETADAGVRFAMFGSDFTDKLLGRSENERFEKYMLRQGMREFSQKVYEDNPDAAARLLSENPLLQKLAYAAALAQGGTKEEAELAQKAYSELVLESGLKKEDINENVALFAEVLSPLSLPGTNTATKFLNKGTTKFVQKTGELALKGVAAPIAKGIEKTAGVVEAGIEGAQNLSRKIGEYTVGDPDTLLKATVTTAAAPVRIPAKMVRGIARTVYDVASEAGPGRIGMFERAGKKLDSGALTKKLFSSEALGGKGRARVADWAVRQTNAIVQPAVNGAVLNVALGLPDIESATDLGYMAGVGAGIGGFGGSRLQERGMALFDPTTSLAQKIDAVVTPDPMGLRRDQDADIKRFLSTADSSLVDSINELSNVNNIKSALEVKIKNLEGRRDAQIRKEDSARIQRDINNLKAQRIELEKVNPETENEIKRQVQLSFADAMDLAKTTGAAAGLSNIEVKVLKPEQMDQFYRDKFGKTLTDAESVVKQLVGNPNLSPSEQELLTRADATIRQYLSDVAGASTARGFAISERPDVPEHLRMQNQKGATVVINGDLVSQMGRDGLNLSRVINHEMQHALSNFTEVRQMLDPIRRQLFDQKIQNPDGTFDVVSSGMITDAELDKYAIQYAAGMDASGGASFLGQFANQDQLRAYMKEEVLSELAGLSGASHGDLRSGLDSVGRQAVDWLETKTKTGALKTIKEGLRQFGIGFDDQGKFTSVLGTNLPPEAFSMIRQYQRKMRDLNESLVYNSSPLKDAPEIPLTALATNRALQERYKHSDFFEQQQVVTLESPDGSKQEVVVPADAKLDRFVGQYRFANGQLVDEQGNPISLGPDIPLQAMPDGTSVSLDTRIARNPDGSPRILSPRESKRRAKQRGEIIRKAVDDAPDDESGVRLEDMGNGNYRGTLSPTQIEAINNLPNDIVAPSLKRKIAFFNDILGRKDGSIVEIEYQAALRDGKYRALKPQLRTEIPIGFQFDKQGNFLMTTMSLSRMYDKANAWAAKRPRNLRLWGGDMTKFWDSVRQYLMNHQKGLQGHIGLNADPEIAMQMKNRINDLFNVYRKETREANPERTILPKRRGQDPMDVVIRSRRMDRINSFDETALPKMPFQYELAVQNYLPAENPFAELQDAQQFAKAMEVDEELVNRAIAGDIEPLELQLHEQDLLRPAEYIDVSNGKIRVRSMFDPTQAIFEQGESNPESPSQLQFLPSEIEAPSGERGFQSKLQMEIQSKFLGAMATPEQLKAVLNNPQNVKAEEVKWSGVNDAIDRLASENNGKVPVQELLNYLRDEGQVKFEEVTIGYDNEIQKIADQYRIKIEDEYGEKAFYDEFDEPLELDEVPPQLLDAIYKAGKKPEPSYAQYQLPGGENYREVVMAMPSQKGVQILKDGKVVWEDNEITPTGKQISDLKYQYPESKGYSVVGKGSEQYTSSHFPEIPNYVAHMRLNERTIQDVGYAIRNTESGRKGPVKATRAEAEADLKQYPASYSLEIVEVPRNVDGLFIEELQSDRHQAGREEGYTEDTKPLLIEEEKRLDSIREKIQFLEENGIDEDNPTPEYRSLDAEFINLARRLQGGSIRAVPDAPFRKDWSLQLFKRALRDAVESGKQWIGWTTGETQAERYDLSKQIGKVVWNEDTKMLTAYDPSQKKTVIQESNITSEKLADYVGKEVAQKLVEQSPDEDMDRQISGLDLKVGGEGMKGFYDTILPKELGKYVAKMGGKVEKSEIVIEKPSTFTKFTRTPNSVPEIINVREKTAPIWRVNITPQMENVVRAGQLQFMPAEQTINKVPTQEELDAMKALLPKYTSKLRNINKNEKYITVYDENGKHAGSAEIYVNKPDNFISIEWIDTTIQKNKGFGQALYREIAKYAQQQNIDTIEGEIINKKAVKRREELFETISKSEGTLEGDYDEDPNKGYYADLTSKVPPDIRFMPAEVDARYIDLEAKAKAGDKEAEAEAIAIVENIAKNAGGIEAWHFGSFDPSYDPIPKTKKGMHFGSKEASIQRAFDKQPEDERRSLEIFEENGLWYWKTNTNESLDGFSTKQLAENNANNAIAEMWMYQDYDYNDVGNLTKTYLFFNNLKTVKDQGDNWNDTIIKSKEEGYDGLKYKNEFEDKGSTSYVIFNPQQAKSADPFTYDDAGALIPLSERFQSATPDIRFLPAEQGEPEGLQGIELPQTYRRISDMIPPLRDIEPPVRPVQALPNIQFLPEEKTPTAKEVLKKPLENLPLKEVSTWTEIQKAPIITLKDLIGKKVFPTFADITSAGRVFKGIDSSELLIPIETHGGPEWPLIQPEKVGEETNIWSNQGAGVSTTKAKRAEEGAIMLVTLMDKNAHLSNTEVANAIIGTNLAYVKDGRITKNNLKLLNKKIKEEEAFKDFVGIDSTEINDYVAKLPFQGDKSRARLATILSSKEAESLGSANVQRILDEMRSPAFEGGRIGDSVIALQLSKGAPVVKLSESGAMTHPSYQYAVRGKVIGKFARPINAEMIYDDFLAQRRLEGKPTSGDRRAIDLAKPVQIITKEIANRIPQTPYKYLKSAQHAKLLKYALENDWKDSAVAKNKGGISPAEFIDTLNSSEAKVALNDYTLDSVKKEIKDGKLNLYQLGDSKVFFGTKNSDPASDYGLDPKDYGFGENEKTLTLVLNAERGTAGMGDAIMMKALSEGVTALDCFAIKNSRYPDGMLPSLYKRFGFEVVGEIPFDPQYYTPQKLADIKLFWKNNGWDESTGLPSVVMMKWKGNENDRTRSLRDIAGKAPAGIRERNSSPIRDTEGYFGRTDIGQGGGSQGGLQQGDSGRGRGSQGDALQGIQLGRGTINAIQELFGMNDAELKNLGINPSQIQTIKKAIGYSTEKKKN